MNNVGRSLTQDEIKELACKADMALVKQIGDNFETGHFETYDRAFSGAAH